MGNSNFLVGGGGVDLFLMGFRGRFIKNFPNVAEGWGLQKIAREKTFYHHNPCQYNYETLPEISYCDVCFVEGMMNG